MGIQILQYEFLGPVQLSQWGPPMGEVIYLILRRTKDTFEIIYADQAEKTEDAEFFTKNQKFQCWLQNAGNQDNLYLAIYQAHNLEPNMRKKILDKIIQRYLPLCNEPDQNSKL